MALFKFDKTPDSAEPPSLLKRAGLSAFCLAELKSHFLTLFSKEGGSAESGVLFLLST